MKGYTTQEIQILPTHSRQLDIRLKPEGIALQEVTVKPSKEKYSKKDNPAVIFVRKMIERRDMGNPRNKAFYQYDQYEKILLGLNEFERKPPKNGKKGKFDFLHEFVDTLESGKTILPVMEKNSYITRTEYSELTGLLKTKASVELKKWYEEGKIDKNGRAPHIVYKKKELQTGSSSQDAENQGV